MATVVTMPRLSDTMTEGTVATWLKKVGDSFELPTEPGIKYEVVNLEGSLENGVKLRKTGAEGASPEDITISAGN